MIGIGTAQTPMMAGTTQTPGMTAGSSWGSIQQQTSGVSWGTTYNLNEVRVPTEAFDAKH